MKKLLALLLVGGMALSAVGCGSEPQTSEPEAKEEAPKSTEETASNDSSDSSASNDSGAASEITLWTYPIGKWGDEATVTALTDAFKAETGISVKVEFLAYADGDDKVNTAIAAGQAPDLIMEGPERLVANWGANGHMVDLSDMLDDTDKAEILPAPLAACTAPDGAIYEYPLVMTAHCMAVNLDAFKEAGADQYLDLETHTWTTDDFVKAVEALYAHY